MAEVLYGACGNERCLDCRPIFDADNNPIPGTDTAWIGNDELRMIVEVHLNRKGRDS